MWKRKRNSSTRQFLHRLVLYSRTQIWLYFLKKMTVTLRKGVNIYQPVRQYSSFTALPKQSRYTDIIKPLCERHKRRTWRTGWKNKIEKNNVNLMLACGLCHLFHVYNIYLLNWFSSREVELFLTNEAYWCCVPGEGKTFSLPTTFTSSTCSSFIKYRLKRYMERHQ